MAYLDEMVFRMPAMSVRALEEVATVVLEEICPEALVTPMELDVLRLVEEVFPTPAININVYPASAVELGDREGATNPEEKGIILIDEELWANLQRGGRRANRARATVMHEFSHEILHSPLVRRWMNLPNRDLLLNRVSRGSIPAYRDPEWQAWTLAGCLLAPRVTMQQVASMSVRHLADFYGVSDDMMRNHCRRLGIKV